VSQMNPSGGVGLRSQGSCVRIAPGSQPSIAENTDTPPHGGAPRTARLKVSDPALTQPKVLATAWALTLEWFRARSEMDGAGCQVWTGATCNGYGRIRRGGRNQYVHRVVWELHRGRLRPGRTIDHLCLNPRCIRLEHLEPVSFRVNVGRRAEAERALDLLVRRRKHGLRDGLLETQTHFRRLPPLTRAAVIRRYRAGVAS
jgi:hypothetical protein